MASLPNITIADIGIIAFWNAHDHRVNGASIDPTDCIPTFSTYTVYDNGIDGKIDPSAKGWGGSDRQINVRVKNDGWIVAWIDRTNTFFYPTKNAGDFGESGYKGYYDILWDWFHYEANISSSYTTLSYMIYKLFDTLSNKAEFTFSTADVGHYSYEFTDASAISLIDICGTQTGAIQYTTGTTLYYAAVTAASWGTGKLIKFDDNIINDLPGGSHYATADILAENWVPNPLTDYELYVYGVQCHGSILVIWA